MNVLEFVFHRGAVTTVVWMAPGNHRSISKQMQYRRPELAARSGAGLEPRTDTFTCIIGNAQNGNYIQRVVKTHALHLEPYVPESNCVWQFSCTTVLGQPNSKNDRLICVSFMVSNVWCVRTTSWVLSQFHNMYIYFVHLDGHGPGWSKGLEFFA